MDALFYKSLKPHKEPVRSEWVDYNGHMNVAYYMLVFDHASDVFLEQIGLDQAFRDFTKCSVFVVEAHIIYENEVMEGDPLIVDTQALDFDAKRIHLFHRMIREGSDETVSTNELMFLYVDMQTRRSASMPETINACLRDLKKSQEALPRPAQAGRSIGIARGTKPHS